MVGLKLAHFHENFMTMMLKLFGKFLVCLQSLFQITVCWSVML